jgi:hypothetical protein
LLSDLCWLTEHEDNFQLVRSQLLRNARRVYGQFFDQRLNIPDSYTNEIASTYAEAAFRLGFFPPQRLLMVDELQQLRASIDEPFLASNHTLPELTSRFGPPSHDVLGGQTTVFCYGCNDPSMDWVYFDFCRCYPPKDLRTYEWFGEEILRDVRMTSNRFILLPFADWCRNSIGKADN